MLISLVLTAALGADAADLVVDPEVQRVMQILARDPDVRRVQRAAVDYFRVSQEDIAGYRSGARLRALLPTISGGYTYDDTLNDRISTDRVAVGINQPFDPNNPQITDITNGVGRAFSAGAAWNLGGLVFNGAEIDAYSLVGIYEDVVKQVTRIYYTRQHNLLALALDPPDNPRAKAGLVLRTQELDSMLDAYTGGAWTKMKKGTYEDD